MLETVQRVRLVLHQKEESMQEECTRPQRARVPETVACRVNGGSLALEIMVVDFEERAESSLVAGYNFRPSFSSPFFFNSVLLRAGSPIATITSRTLRAHLSHAIGSISTGNACRFGEISHQRPDHRQSGINRPSQHQAAPIRNHRVGVHRPWWHLLNNSVLLRAGSPIATITSRTLRAHLSHAIGSISTGNACRFGEISHQRPDHRQSGINRPSQHQAAPIRNHRVGVHRPGGTS
ncbi:myb domain protein 112, partial [Striga asiatica]